MTNKLTAEQKKLVRELIKLENDFGFDSGRDQSSDKEEWKRAEKIKQELGLEE